jgi:hypothetical protein
MKTSAHELNGKNEKVRQLQYVSDGWKRNLGFILQETAFCKYRLSEVIRTGAGDPGTLEEAESYLNSFIQNETLIVLLRSDINKFDNSLPDHFVQHHHLSEEIASHHQQIKWEVQKLNEAYHISKLNFDVFLNGLA